MKYPEPALIFFSTGHFERREQIDRSDLKKKGGRISSKTPK